MEVLFKWRNNKPATGPSWGLSHGAGDHPPRRAWRQAGVTLIELLVVLAILGVALTLVAPSMFRAVDRLTFYSAGRRVVASFRTAQVEARMHQQQILATIVDGALVFHREGQPVSRVVLPAGVKADTESTDVAYAFLASGQILGPDRLTLSFSDSLRGHIVLGPNPGSIRFEEGR